MGTTERKVTEKNGARSSIDILTLEGDKEGHEARLVLIFRAVKAMFVDAFLAVASLVEGWRLILCVRDGR